MEKLEEIGTVYQIQKEKSYSLRTEGHKVRRKRLRKIEKWILENQSHIHEAVYQDLQKPPREVDLSEIYPVLTEVRHTLRNLANWMKPQSASSSLSYLGTSGQVVLEPKGVCLVISPWNYPFNLAVGPIVSALAAGNTVLLKPSEYTPATSRLLSKMFDELFENELCAVFEGDAEVAKQLLSLPIDHVFFTGSPGVGKIVMKSAAENLASVTLELGGKSPTIIDNTVNIKDAAEKVAWGKWLNAGQTCVAPDYLFVHEEVKEDFISALKLCSSKLYGNEADYTGIIHENHFNRLKSFLEEAVSKGNELLFGGEMNPEKLRMAPTALLITDLDIDLMKEEVFGPILPVMTYQNIEEVISFINSHPKPLALYLFSKRKKIHKRLLQETSAGTMAINDCVLQFAHPSLPFGGVNNSGFGKAHGKAGFVAFSNEKSVLRQRTGLTMAKTVYPPYSKLKNWTVKYMLRYF